MEAHLPGTRAAARHHGRVWRWEVVAGLALTHGLRSGAELGVSQGRFTSFLCSRIPDLTMVAVDLWAPQPGDRGEGTESYADWPHERNYENFCQHCNRHFPGRVRVLRMSTLEAASLVPDGSLDFVFVDADHTYGAVLADIAAWRPKLRPNGLLAGHDYNWPSVRQAVDEAVGKVTLYRDNVWTKFL